MARATIETTDFQKYNHHPWKADTMEDYKMHLLNLADRLTSLACATGYDGYFASECKSLAHLSHYPLSQVRKVRESMVSLLTEMVKGLYASKKHTAYGESTTSYIHEEVQAALLKISTI